MAGETPRKPWWRRWFGSRSERAAERFLRRLGYRVVARNYSCSHGELDLVAVDGACVVFVEVRSTGMAIAYNVSVTVFGGFAPLTVTWLIAATGSKLMPAYYIIAAALLSIVVVGSTLGAVRRAAGSALSSINRA